MVVIITTISYQCVSGWDILATKNLHVLQFIHFNLNFFFLIKVVWCWRAWLRTVGRRCWYTLCLINIVLIYFSSLWSLNMVIWGFLSAWTCQTADISITGRDGGGFHSTPFCVIVTNRVKILVDQQKKLEPVDLAQTCLAQLTVRCECEY